MGIDVMAMTAAHFTVTEGGEFAPTEFAQSHWGDDHLNGPAAQIDFANDPFPLRIG